MHPVESKAWFLLDLCPLPLEFLSDLSAFSAYIYVLTFKSPLLQQCTPGRECELCSAEMFPCWLPWCGTSGCVGWWIDGAVWQVTVEFCLPVSYSDSSYGLTSFSSCQFLKNTQEFSLSFQFHWSTLAKNHGGEKHTNIKKNPTTSNKKPILLIQKM